MGSLFNTVFKVVSTLIGVLMVCLGGVWVLQGLDIAFQGGSFMAGDPKWAVYGAILALVGVGQAIWSVTRRPAPRPLPDK
jgi:hypothetical protein